MTSILIVGPEEALEEGLITGLVAEDIAVTQVEAAATALDYIDHKRPDVVLLHSTLTEWESIQVIRYVESAHPEIAVLTLVERAETGFIDSPGLGVDPVISSRNEWEDIVDIIKERALEGESGTDRPDAYQLAIAVSGIGLEALGSLKKVSKYRESPAVVLGTTIVSTREVFEDSICTRLADVPDIAEVWISHVDRDAMELIPTAAGSTDPESIPSRAIASFEGVDGGVLDGDVQFIEADDGGLAVVPFVKDGMLDGTLHVRTDGDGFSVSEWEYLRDLGQIGSRFLTALSEMGEQAPGSTADSERTDIPESGPSPDESSPDGLEAGDGTASGELEEGLKPRHDSESEETEQEGGTPDAGSASPATPNADADETDGETKQVDSLPASGAGIDGPDPSDDRTDSDGSSDREQRGPSPTEDGDPLSVPESGSVRNGSEAPIGRRGRVNDRLHRNGGNDGGDGNGSASDGEWGRVPALAVSLGLILLMASVGLAAPGGYVPTHINQEPVYCGSCHPAQAAELNRTSHLQYFVEKTDETYYNMSGEHLSSAEAASGSCMLCHNYWNRRSRLYAQNFSLQVAEADGNTTIYEASYDGIVPTGDVPNATLRTGAVTAGGTTYTRMDLVWENLSTVSPSEVRTQSCGEAQRGITCHAAVTGLALAKNESISEVPGAGGGSIAFYQHSMMSTRWTGTNRKQITMCGSCHFGKLPPSHASGVPKDREGNLTWTYSMNDTQTLTASYPLPNWAHSNVQCLDCHAHARELNASR